MARKVLNLIQGITLVGAGIFLWLPQSLIDHDTSKIIISAIIVFNAILQILEIK